MPSATSFGSYWVSTSRLCFRGLSAGTDRCRNYNVGHLGRVQRINELADSLPGVELAGNGFGGVGIPHCIHTGQRAAQRLRQQLAPSA